MAKNNIETAALLRGKTEDDAIASAILDNLAKQWGPETFVWKGYGYYGDAHDAIVQALKNERKKHSWFKWFK